MPPRRQLLTLGATLAIGMILGSLATLIILPAVQKHEKADRSRKKPLPPISPLVATVDTKAKDSGAGVVPPEEPSRVKPLPVKKPPRKVVDATPPTSPPPVRPGEAEQPKTLKLRPEDVLRNKGLQLSGQVAVLELEDEIKRREVEVDLGFKEQTRIAARLIEIEDLVQTLQREWANLEQKQQQILARRFGDQRMIPGDADGLRKGALDPRAEEQEREPGGTEQVKKSKEPTKKNQRELPAGDERVLEAEWMQNATRMNAIENQLSGLKSEHNGLNKLTLEKQGAIERQIANLQPMGDELNRKYHELASDSEVRTALEELNTNRAGPIVLGPRDDFLKNLLKIKGLRPAGGGRPVPVFEANQNRDVKSIEFRARTAEGQLIKAWDRQQAARKAPASRGNEIAIRTAAAEIKLRRGEFVQNVAALRTAVDEALRKHAELKKDPQFNKAILAPVSLSTRGYLERAEAAIETREIKLTRDRAVSLVDAMVNRHTKKMLIDPSVEFVRMSSDVARELGISPTESDASADLTMPDGQKLKARRTTIKSVQVGPFAVENVECLVVLDRFEAPPVLGASFLDHFVSRFEPTAENLTLVRVDVKKLPSKLGSQGPQRAARAGR